MATEYDQKPLRMNYVALTPRGLETVVGGRVVYVGKSPVDISDVLEVDPVVATKRKPISHAENSAVLMTGIAKVK